jgi:hypothetical protein
MMSNPYYTEDTPVKPFGGSIYEVDDRTSAATVAINVNLGEIGFITLYLCEKCASEFKDNCESHFNNHIDC